MTKKAVGLNTIYNFLIIILLNKHSVIDWTSSFVKDEQSLPVKLSYTAQRVDAQDFTCIWLLTK